MRSPDPLRPGDTLFSHPDQDSRFNLVCTRIALVGVLGLAAIAFVTWLQTGAVPW